MTHIEQQIMRIIDILDDNAAAIESQADLTKPIRQAKMVRLALRDLAEGRALLDYPPLIRMTTCMLYAAVVGNVHHALDDEPAADKVAKTAYMRIAEQAYNMTLDIAQAAVEKEE